MAVFSELVKNFEKIRDYMRDFYIYGFKSRSDFSRKSLRTYDDEKRRIEGYLGEYMKWEYGKSGKRTFISLDSSEISQNPLYAAWKSKSFTTNDIELHFYLLDCLSSGKNMTVPELTDTISDRSEKIFDAQIIRHKCVEYAKEGLLTSKKQGKTVLYGLSDLYFDKLKEKLPMLPDAVKFFQEAAIFGEVGNFILDNEDEQNKIFSFKHHYIVHTLEDLVLFEILSAIRKGKRIKFDNFSEKTGTTSYEGVPLKIFVSVTTGRRYVCIYMEKKNRFTNFRLDYIKSVVFLEHCGEAVLHKAKLNKNLDKIWGVGFGGRSRNEILSLKLFIDEKSEQYIIERIKREGRGGSLERLEMNTFLYTKECYDTTEMAPWIKTFTGRILALECSNPEVADRFLRDIASMHKMYNEEM